MNYDEKNDVFFKNLASLYVEKDGERLKNELEEMENDSSTSYPQRLDKRIRSNVRMSDIRRAATILAPAAACFLLIFALWGRMPAMDISGPLNMNFSSPAYITSETSSPPSAADSPANLYSEYASDADVSSAAEAALKQTQTDASTVMALMAARLPYGYDVTGVDYDNAKTIYHILNDTNNQIVLTTEKTSLDIDLAYYQEIRINGVRVFGMVKNDYSLITYEQDGLIYTLTSRYNYKDLIDISKNII